MRYFIHLAYKGTHYHGWQIQPNATTVQETLNHALSTILREEINVIGAGRTDTGVHASSFYAHIDIEEQIKDIHKLVFKLNTFLPPDIAVYKINPVRPNAHARFDALSRTYKYHITLEKNPFLREYAYYLYQNVDIVKMNKACSLLFNYKDFTSFSKSNTQTKTNLCDIYSAHWETEKPQQLVFTIKANRFLRNMVRAIVGTLLEIGQDKLTVEEFKDIIESRDRSKAGYSMPANGLFLVNIDYPQDIYAIQ